MKQNQNINTTFQIESHEKEEHFEVNTILRLFKNYVVQDGRRRTGTWGSHKP